MTIKSIIKRTAIGLAGLATLFVLSGTAHAIPYNGDQTQASPVPAFNVFTGAPAPAGNEPDFLKARVDDGSNTDYSDPLNTSCSAGEKMQLRVYVHNGASTAGNNGGSGPSVAHNTKVSVSIPTAQMSSFNPIAKISASNASTVTDGVVINCGGGKQVKLHYINGSASAYSLGTGVVPVSDSIVTSAGAAIRSEAVPGDVWGCWDERVYVVLSVQVEEVTPPKSLGECKLLTVDQLDNRKVKATVNASVDNAKVLAYKIDWGDGSSSTKQSDSHQYANDGTFTIKGSVQIQFANGDKKWVTSDINCAKQVKFESGKPVTPPQTPTTLTSTGAGNVFGIFAATSIAGAVLHRIYALRKAARV